MTTKVFLKIKKPIKIRMKKHSITSYFESNRIRKDYLNKNFQHQLNFQNHIHTYQYIKSLKLIKAMS